MEDKELQEQIRAAVENPDLPHLYFNGFSVTISAGDVLIVLRRQDIPIATLNVSYTIAKTFVEKLASGMTTLEEKTGKTIMTTEFIRDRLTEQEPENGDV